MVYFLCSLICTRAINRDDATIVVLIITAITVVCIKIIYFEQIVSIAPLMFVSNFFILVAVIFGKNEFSHVGFILINISGFVALIVGSSVEGNFFL